MLPLTIGQNTTISHLQCQTFQHIGKEADLMWSQEASSKGVFTLSLWMHKGTRGPPEQVGCNYGKLKSSYFSVSHKHPEIHSSAPTPGPHKISNLHPKGNSKQACSFHVLLSIPWNKTLGTLGPTLGQINMSWAEQTEGPWGHLCRIETHILVFWNCIL